jgi:lysozyme family protein
MAILNYLTALEAFKENGSITLLDVKQMSYQDLNDFFEDLKYWKVYGGNDIAKLGEKY